MTYMKLSIRAKSILIEIICYLYMLLFVYAAVSKLLDFSNFVLQLGQSDLLSDYSRVLAILVPVLELLIALLLVVKTTRKVGLYASFNLMFLFTVYIFVILTFSSSKPCSCGGILEKMGWTEHLIFNIVFLFIALLGIFIIPDPISSRGHQWQRYQKIIIVTILSFLSAGLMYGLFQKAQQKLEEGNTFIRNFAPHTGLIKIKKMKSDSYYFAGGEGNTLYIGDYSYPLRLMVLDSLLNEQRREIIDLDKKDLPFRTVSIKVNPPDFFVTDYTIPAVFHGKIHGVKAVLNWRGQRPLLRHQIIDSSHLAFTRIGSEGKTVLGLSTFADEKKEQLQPELLQGQKDGLFDVDGLLHYDAITGRLIYTYIYRNEFLVMDKTLNLLYRGTTLDTNSIAKINIGYNKRRKEKKLSTPGLVVTSNSTVYNNVLFMKSALRSKNESLRRWKNASVIDTYTISNGAYITSFYIPNMGRETLKSFYIQGSYLYGFVGQSLVKYKLPSKILKNYLQNTGQYQGNGRKPEKE